MSELSTHELEAVVRRLAAGPEHWRHLVCHDPDQRTYVELHRDDQLAVWLICWMDDHDTGFHDHDLSGGAVAVVEGAVAEDRLVLGGEPVTEVFQAGAAFSFTASDIHRVRHAGEAPAVTIHAYSPPLWRMGAYEILPGGELRRHSLSYAEELRPLAGEETLRPFGG
jgi:predicted metal-dependent enzyme (double-stranded beta helix superfamily)